MPSETTFEFEHHHFKGEYGVLQTDVRIIIEEFDATRWQPALHTFSSRADFFRSAEPKIQLSPRGTAAEAEKEELWPVTASRPPALVFRVLEISRRRQTIFRLAVKPMG